MIRTEREYREAVRRLKEGETFIVAQRSELESLGATPSEVEVGMEPILTYHRQLQEEVCWFEEIRKGIVPPARSIVAIGDLLIASRIAAGVTQRDLADRLGVSEAQVSRDERNEYNNITLSRAQRILDVLGVCTVTTATIGAATERRELQSMEAGDLDFTER